MPLSLHYHIVCLLRYDFSFTLQGKYKKLDASGLHDFTKTYTI